VAQEYGIFFVGMSIDYKPDTGEYVANVTAQVEAFGFSKIIRRQVASVTLAQVMELVYALFRAVAITKEIPVPEWAGEAPEGYTPTYEGPVMVLANLSPGPEIVSIPDWGDMDPSEYGPPEPPP
jgi:hypothetical protein